jgi:hypothetical protein
MNEVVALFSGGFGIFLLILVVVWAVLWFFVPFYISSLNKNIKELLAVNKQIAEYLRPEGNKPVVSGSNKKYEYEYTEDEKKRMRKLGVKID